MANLPDLVDTIVGHIRPRSCLLLFLVPVTTTAVYAPVATFIVAFSAKQLVDPVRTPAINCRLVSRELPVQYCIGHDKNGTGAEVGEKAGASAAL